MSGNKSESAHATLLALQSLLCRGQRIAAYPANHADRGALTRAERAGHRPASVLTPARYNDLRSRMICCPMTSRAKGSPFEVVGSRDLNSAVLADQVKNLDWRARKAVRKGKISAAALGEVRAKIKALLGM